MVYEIIVNTDRCGILFDYENDNNRIYEIVLDDRIKISKHKETFKSKQVLWCYLDAVFGKEWNLRL